MALTPPKNPGHLGRSINKFVPQIWSAKLLVQLRKVHIFGQSGVINRDYEGDIRNAGDQVNITSVDDPTIGEYTAHKEIDLETLNESGVQLRITESPYFSFVLDDIENAQALNGGAVMSEAASRAAYKLADRADMFLAQKMAKEAKHKLAEVDASGDHGVWEKVLLPLRLRLDKANVPFQGRWAIVSPEVYGQLLLDDRFVRIDASGTSEGLRNGIVGRAAGFDIMMSNNTNAPAGSKYPNPPTTPGGTHVYAGHAMGLTFAQQIAKVEAFKPERYFSQALKGLHLYGAQTIRPEVLATIQVKPTVTPFESITLTSGGGDDQAPQKPTEPAPDDEGPEAGTDESPEAGEDEGPTADPENETAPTGKSRRSGR